MCLTNCFRSELVIFGRPVDLMGELPLEFKELDRSGELVSPERDVRTRGTLENTTDGLTSVGLAGLVGETGLVRDSSEDLLPIDPLLIPLL